MRRNTSTKIASIALISTVLTSLTTVNTVSSSNNCLIVVGIASKDFRCKKGDDAVAYPTHAGYQAMYNNNSDNYYNTANYIKTLLRDKYHVQDKNITMFSSDKATCVIIQYQQEIKGWNCTVFKCAVGFGENKDVALANAVSQKNTAVGIKVPYLEMTTFNCPE